MIVCIMAHELLQRYNTHVINALHYFGNKLHYLQTATHLVLIYDFVA